MLKEKHFGTVVMLGPSHRYAFQGISVLDDTIYKTPLGITPINVDVAKFIREQTKSKYISQAFLQEHSLEVEMPFLQHVLQSIYIKHIYYYILINRF